MAKAPQRKSIDANETQLNDLFRETLDGIRDDIIEAQQNVQMYLDAIINDAGGKEMYGSFYNDALKIKAMTRDKQLKFLGMFKERVSTKELRESAAQKEGGSMLPSHTELNKFIENMDKDNHLQKPVITPLREDEEDEEDGAYGISLDDDDDE